jgi:hypothetical protein
MLVAHWFQYPPISFRCRCSLRAGSSFANSLRSWCSNMYGRRRWTQCLFVQVFRLGVLLCGGRYSPMNRFRLCAASSLHTCLCTCMHACAGGCAGVHRDLPRSCCW